MSGAFHVFLGRVGADEVVDARHALGALAFAEAPGFIGDVWSVAFRVIHGHGIDPDRLRHLASSAAASGLVETIPG